LCRQLLGPARALVSRRVGQPRGENAHLRTILCASSVLGRGDVIDAVFLEARLVRGRGFLLRRWPPPPQQRQRGILFLFDRDGSVWPRCLLSPGPRGMLDAAFSGLAIRHLQALITAVAGACRDDHLLHLRRLAGTSDNGLA
ncbi:unnamed protein product, partial [Ectocarpus sp. 8 AP-2014]